MFDHWSDQTSCSESFFCIFTALVKTHLVVLGDSDDPEVEADDDAQGDEDGDQKVRYRAGVAPKIFFH